MAGAAVRIQAWLRGCKQRTDISDHQKAVLHAAGVHLSTSVSGDARSIRNEMRKEMLKLDGKVLPGGIVRWPKGTVTKLLRERTEYAGKLARHHRELEAREASKVAVAEVANAAISTLLAPDSAEADPADAIDRGPVWSTEDWLSSLRLPDVLSSCLLERLRARSTERRLERLFVAELGRKEKAERARIIRALLDEGPTLDLIANAIADGAARLSTELSKASAHRTDAASGAMVRRASKFFDDGCANIEGAEAVRRPTGSATGDGSGDSAAGRGSNQCPPPSSRCGGDSEGTAGSAASAVHSGQPFTAGSASAAARGSHDAQDGVSSSDAPDGFTLAFGDVSDFMGGLPNLVGAADPISLRLGVCKDHTEAVDSDAIFTASNYGTTTTSRTEYWCAPSHPPRLARHALCPTRWRTPAKPMRRASPVNAACECRL